MCVKENQLWNNACVRPISLLNDLYVKMTLVSYLTDGRYIFAIWYMYTAPLRKSAPGVQFLLKRGMNYLRVVFQFEMLDARLVGGVVVAETR